jgi:hypothetical protein
MLSLRDHFPLPPAIELSAQGTRLYIFYALAIAAIVVCLYACLVVTTDNTNLGTTNGLWKAPSVSAWEHHTGTPVDNGGFLYLPVYGALARLIPDSVVQYGAHTPLPAFRKMALLNALLGGIASGLVFFLAMRLTSSFRAAGLVVIAHAGAAFVILNSINSEDIIPAYTWFVAAIVFFFEFLRSGKLAHYLGSAFFMALATLFHWTLMAPGLAAFGAVYAMIVAKTAMANKRIYFAAGAAWLFVFLCFVQAVILLCLPRYHIPIWAVIYPTKAEAGGWLGLNAEKLFYLFIGIGNYFSGGQNSTDYRFSFQGAFLKLTILSWVYGLVTLGTCVAALVRKRATPAIQYLSVFALVLFAAGELGAVYSQPQDPQMQIQPMLACTLGLILLARKLHAPLLIASLALLAAINGAWNVHLFRQQAAGDSLALSGIKQLDVLFPKDRTVLVSQGFEGWVTWQRAILWAGDRQGFVEHNLLLTDPFINHRGISGADAALLMTKAIDHALAAGMGVAAAELWTQTPEEFSSSLTTVTTLEQARIYDAILRRRYRSTRSWNTALGQFVEIVPAR